MAEEKSKMTLSKVFKFAAKAALISIPLFLGATVGTELLTYTLAHNNLGGMAFMAAIDPWFQNAYDMLGVTSGLESVASMVPQAPSMVPVDPNAYAMDALDFYQNFPGS